MKDPRLDRDASKKVHHSKAGIDTFTENKPRIRLPSQILRTPFFPDSKNGQSLKAVKIRGMKFRAIS